jgi:hypothetical protein
MDPAIVRWVAYEFKHVRGREEVVSDGLSRKQMDDPFSSDDEDIIEGDLGIGFSIQCEAYEGEGLDLAKLENPRDHMTKFKRLRKWSYGFIFEAGAFFRKTGKGRMPRRVMSGRKSLFLKSYMTRQARP